MEASGGLSTEDPQQSEDVGSPRNSNMRSPEVAQLRAHHPQLFVRRSRLDVLRALAVRLPRHVVVAARGDESGERSAGGSGREPTVPVIPTSATGMLAATEGIMSPQTRQQSQWLKGCARARARSLSAFAHRVHVCVRARTWQATDVCVPSGHALAPARQRDGQLAPARKSGLPRQAAAHPPAHGDAPRCVRRARWQGHALLTRVRRGRGARYRGRRRAAERQSLRGRDALRVPRERVLAAVLPDARGPRAARHRQRCGRVRVAVAQPALGKGASARVCRPAGGARLTRASTGERARGELGRDGVVPVEHRQAAAPGADRNCVAAERDGARRAGRRSDLSHGHRRGDERARRSPPNRQAVGATGPRARARRAAARSRTRAPLVWERR
jgi:hypothetical protein